MAEPKVTKKPEMKQIRLPRKGANDDNYELVGLNGKMYQVPCGKTVYDSNGLFALNELGAFLWDRLPKADSEEELVAAVLEEYEVTREEAAKDIAEFLAKLKDMEIL